MQSDTRTYSIDNVRSIWCPKWPREAKEWPTRPRNNEWPTIDTVSQVLKYGCHIVYVQHRDCRDDSEQWRFSFSLAEVILIQSFTQIQQIVYHLLRFFAKKELIQEDCPKEDEVLCTYHLKTLMLWNCEEMSPEKWDSSSVIATCCELLNILSGWLKRKHFPNYFIPEANLFHQPSRSTLLHQTERRLNEFLKCDILSHWFVENYIQPVTRTQLQFLNTRNVASDFMDYLLPLIVYRKESLSKSLDSVFSLKVCVSNKVYRDVIKYGTKFSGLNAMLKLWQSAISFDLIAHQKMIYLPTIQKVLCFKHCDFLLCILHFAHGLDCGEISWNNSLSVEFVNAIMTQPKIIRSQYHNFPRPVEEQSSSRFKFLRAQNFMENLTGSCSRSEFQLLSLMSKELLRDTLETDDFESSGIAPAALAYLAALYFATSDYQQALHLSLTVLKDQTSIKDKETLNAGCLLFINDVARIVGLCVCVFHKNIMDINYHYKSWRLYLDLRLSPDVFAYYLAVLSAERMSKKFDFYPDLPDSPFPMDINILALVNPRSIRSE